MFRSIHRSGSRKLGEEPEGEGSGGQDRESMALDSTATQWSFQVAYRGMAEYHDDILDDGTVRPAGNNDYVQLRVVAPVPLKTMTLLPRLTLAITKIHWESRGWAIRNCLP